MKHAQKDHGLFSNGLEKNRKSTASGISQAISPGGFFTHLLTDFKGVRELNLRFRLLLFVRQTKSREESLVFGFEWDKLIGLTGFAIRSGLGVDFIPPRFEFISLALGQLNGLRYTPVVCV
jgi:hypothetical protein